MNVSGRKRRVVYGEAPTEKHVTLEDEHLKKLVKKQLSTDTSLKHELAHKKSFTKNVYIKDETVKKTGIRSLSEFQYLEQQEEKITQLRDAGLTDGEIEIKLNSDVRETKYSEVLKLINKKISDHALKLKKAITYVDTVDVTRKEFELNKATYIGCSNKQKLTHLIKVKNSGDLKDDLIVSTLTEFEDESGKKIPKEDNLDVEDSNKKEFIGPLLCDINERVSAIPMEIIRQNQMQVDEILAMSKFKHYTKGVPSKVIYIKNIAKSVKEKDLASLFVHFFIKNQSPVEYKLLTGRMRGQAFVTFKDEVVAERALLHCNGYMFKGKPIIISFGKINP